MAKQGELKFQTERETWSIPYYDLGDVADIGSFQHVRLSENGNRYEIAVWESVYCSHARVFWGGAYPPDWSLNNDTIPTVYDSIFFDQGDIVWQNIRRKRDGTNLLYNRLQQHTGSIYAKKLEWLSPWVVLGLGGQDGQPYYYEEIPTYSNWYYVRNDDSLTDDSDDELTNIDINESKTLIPIVYYYAEQDVYPLELRQIKGFSSSFENKETMAWFENPPNKMCISRAENYVLYEPVTMDIGNAVSLNNSDLVDPSVSLETKKDLDGSYAIPDGYNQGALATKYRNGYDYDVDHANGTVTAIEDRGIDDGEECFVNYLYGTVPKVYIEKFNDLEQRNIADGSVEWTIELNDEVSVLEGGSDGVYVAISDENSIKKYDRTGSLVWENTNVSDYPDHMKLDNNEDYLYYAGNDYLGRIDLSTQTIDWEVSLSGNYTSAIELDYDDSYLYISRRVSGTFELDPTDGTVLRSYPESGDHITVPPPGDTLDPLAFTDLI